MGLFDNLSGMLGGLAGQGGGEPDDGAGAPQPGGQQACGQSWGGQGAMGMIGQLLNQGQGGASSNMIGSLLGAVQGGAPQAAPDQGYGQPGGQAAAGGLAGMLQTLAANGLGEHVSSWLSNTPNLPVSEQQIHEALGSQQVQQLAQSSGLPVGSFLQQLAQHLPQAASEQSGTNPG